MSTKDMRYTFEKDGLLYSMPNLMTRKEFDKAIDDAKSKVAIDELTEAKRQSHNQAIIKRIDQQIVQQQALDNLNELIMADEETSTEGRYGSFLDLALKGPEVTNLFLNYIAVAGEHAPKTSKKKEHKHFGTEACDKKGCFDRELNEFISL